MDWLSGSRSRGRARRWLAPLPLLALGVVTQGGCYNTGDGEEPPLDRFYFPVGLQVSHGGSVLYAVNSDFDLQFNGGTLQAYDLRLIRRHALDIIADPRSPNVPLLRRSGDAEDPCPSSPPVFKEDGTGGVQPLGETCAPPVDSKFYVRDSVIIGAFATDLQLSRPPAQLVPQLPAVSGEKARPCSEVVEPVRPPDTASQADKDAYVRALAEFLRDRPRCIGGRRFDRLFAPVRGNATLTWASVERDSFDAVPPESPDAFYAPFRLGCGRDSSNRCDSAHQAGEDPFEAGNTRNITMPGEPFAMAMSEDGAAVVITHQNETKTTLFSTGLSRDQEDARDATEDKHPVPALQFILDGVPYGGVGVHTVPHDRDAFFGAAALPRAAFLQTSRAIAEVSLIRQYPDEFAGVASSLRRPFLNLEAAFPITASAGGTDSRGIVIDPTPRLACKAKVAPPDPLTARTQADVDQDLQRCGRLPARAFIANRTPAALLVGEIGIAEGADGAYDADRLILHTSIPLSAGPSKIYLAPIVDRDGAYALRVFAVCFDSATVFVIDPDTGSLENVIRTATGPFAMTFDPFTFEDVARHVQVPYDTRDPGRGLRRYRFAYLASFTNSFVQLIDLDDAQPIRATFERIVFTLGAPTPPKGT